MVFTELLLENALAIRPCNYGVASEPLLPKVARCIQVILSRYIGKCAACVLKRSARTHIWGRLSNIFYQNCSAVLIIFDRGILMSKSNNSRSRPAKKTSIKTIYGNLCEIWCYFGTEGIYITCRYWYLR